MSKFKIGDRVQIHGEDIALDLGTVIECKSSYGEDYCNVQWDEEGLAGCYEDDLFLVRAVADCSPKHAKRELLDRYHVEEAILTPHQAVTLASKLLKFATQEGTK